LQGKEIFLSRLQTRNFLSRFEKEELCLKIANKEFSLKIAKIFVEIAKQTTIGVVWIIMTKSFVMNVLSSCCCRTTKDIGDPLLLLLIWAELATTRCSGGICVCTHHQRFLLAYLGRNSPTLLRLLLFFVCRKKIFDLGQMFFLLRLWLH
jgi:hypothetical protein